MLLCDPVFSRSRARPGAVAVIEADRDGNSVTYAGLAAGIDLLTRRLSGMGFAKGARLGILSRNSIGSVEAFFAASRAGGAAVPLNYALVASDIAALARHAGISAIYAGAGLEEKAEAAAKAARCARLTFGEPGNVRGKIPPSGIKEDSIAAIVYTSGTMGRPLGVMLSHKNLLANARSIAGYTAIKASDSICCVLPFYHIYGLSLLLSHLVAGASIILDNRFMYPDAVLDSMERYKATGFAGVSSHYGILLDRSGFKKRRLASLKYFMQAGDRMPKERVTELHDAFPRKKIYLMYGQTEASPRLSYLEARSVTAKPGSVGKAVPGVRLRVVDEAGRECAAGEEGEITARGDNVMLGYWKDPKETKKVLKGGWLYTGDIAYKDGDGDIFLVGRKKDFIKVGGRKVDPSAIEKIILAHEGVGETAVIGVPDPVTGARMMAFVVPAKGHKVKKEEIIRLCSARLPLYSVPTDIRILSALPRSASGKIDRKKLENLR